MAVAIMIVPTIAAMVTWLELVPQKNPDRSNPRKLKIRIIKYKINGDPLFMELLPSEIAFRI